MTDAYSMRFNKTAVFVFPLFLLALVGTGFTWLYLGYKQVNGVIRDATSGKPISAATLQVGSTQIISNERGQFQAYLTGSNNNIPLEARAPGYLPLSITFDLPWYLNSGHLNLNLAPSGFPLQIVDNWTDDPLPNLIVRVGDRAYRTNQDGVANLDTSSLIPPFFITLDQPGYLPKQMKLTRIPDNSTELPLKIDLEPHTLAGVVVAGDTQEPMSDVTIKVGGNLLQTDAEGRFLLFRLRLGDRVSILPDSDFLPTDFRFAGQSTITVPLSAKQLVVQAIDSLSGLPVADVQVKAQGQIKLTNAQGQVALQDVSNQGMLQVSHMTYLSQTVPYQIDQALTILLKPNMIKGVVRDRVTGQPLTHTRVMLNRRPLALDMNGSYQLQDMDRTVTLTLNQAGYKGAQLSLDPRANDFKIRVENLEVRPCQDNFDELPIPCFDLHLQPFEAKAIYVPFTFLSDPNAIYAIFDLVERTELNAIVLDVKSDRGLLAWDSQVEQVDLLGIDGNREGWMRLKTFLTEAKARDIYTVARMVIFKDTPFAFGNADLAITYANGIVWLDGEGAAWANPFREEVWAYNIALAKEVAELGFDEINLDYLRFPSDGNLQTIAFIEESNVETRTTAIRTFVRRMREAVAPYGTFLSADVFGLTVWVKPEDDMNIGQRVIDIAPYVDYLAPMIYPSTFIPGNLGLANPSAQPYEVIFRSQNAAMERMSPTTKVRPWLQAYWYSSQEMLQQKQAANDANSAGWVWWNAAGIYDENIFKVDEDNHQE